jgi:hypothetical protein
VRRRPVPKIQTIAALPYPTDADEPRIEKKGNIAADLQRKLTHLVLSKGFRERAVHETQYASRIATSPAQTCTKGNMLLQRYGDMNRAPG